MTAKKNTAAAEKTGAAVLEGEERPKGEAELYKQVADDANKETLQQKKNRLRNEAEREVLNNHRDEYHEIATAKFAAEGLEFSRRLSDEEKAAKKMEDLMEQYPELRKKFAAEVTGGEEG